MQRCAVMLFKIARWKNTDELLYAVSIHEEPHERTCQQITPRTCLSPKPDAHDVRKRWRELQLPHRLCPLMRCQSSLLPIGCNGDAFVQPYLETHLQGGPGHGKDVCEFMLQHRMRKSLCMDVEAVSTRVFYGSAACANQPLFLLRRCVNIGAHFLWRFYAQVVR